MKVFFGFLLLASLALAAVDESVALGNVPESKKTDLTITTGNGQTIKINTDGVATQNHGFIKSAQRFRMNKVFHRPALKRQGEIPENGSANQSGFDRSDLENEINEVNEMISTLSELKNNGANDEGQIVIHLALLERLAKLLENYYKLLNHIGASDASGGQEDDGQGMSDNEEEVPINSPEGDEGYKRRSRVQAVQVNHWSAKRVNVKRPAFNPLRYGPSKKWFVAP